MADLEKRETQHGGSTHTYSLQGKSGVSLTRLAKVLEDLGIPEEAEIRQYLPTTDPTPTNTIARFRTTIYASWQEARLEGRVSIHDQRHEDTGFSVEVHVGGEDSEGSSLSKERYTLSCSFTNDGTSANVTITHPKKLGTGDGISAIRQAWQEAELSLSSKAWSDSWNRLHRAVRSLQTTSMNYLTFSQEQSDLVDEYVRIAQACGIRCYRHDQPAFVASEQLHALIQAELEEKSRRIDGKGSSSARSAQTRLEAIGNLAETLTSLKGLLGDLSNDLEERVDGLRATWEGVLQTAKSAPKREALTMIRLTPAGREWIEEAQALTEPYTIRASQSAFDAIDALRGLLPNLEGEDLETVRLLDTLCQRLVSVSPADSAIMARVSSLVDQGYIEGSVLEPAETRAIITALTPLLSEPREASTISVEIAPPYQNITLNTYEQG